MAEPSPSPEEIEHRFAEIVRDWDPPAPAARPTPEPFSLDAAIDNATVDDDPYVPPPGDPIPMWPPMVLGFTLMGLALLLAVARLAGLNPPAPMGFLGGLAGIAGLVILLAQAWRRAPRDD